MRVVAEDANRRRAELDMLRFSHRQTNPPRRQDASEVAMGEDSNISVHPAQASDQAVRSLGDMGRSFTVQSAVEEEVPTGS